MRIPTNVFKPDTEVRRDIYRQWRCGIQPADISKRFNTTRDAIDRILRLEVRECIVADRSGVVLEA
jgi:hypothetical protein